MKRLFAPQPGQRMPTQRELKALVDEGREPVVFEWHERSDAQFAYDRVDLPRIAAHEVRERDRFRHPDGPGREEAFEREEIPGVRHVGLAAALLEGAAHESGAGKGIVVHEVPAAERASLSRL